MTPQNFDPPSSLCKPRCILNRLKQILKSAPLGSSHRLVSPKSLGNFSISHSDDSCVKQDLKHQNTRFDLVSVVCRPSEVSPCLDIEVEVLTREEATRPLGKRVSWFEATFKPIRIKLKSLGFLSQLVFKTAQRTLRSLKICLKTIVQQERIS